MRTCVYFADTTELTNDAVFERFFKTVPEERQQRILSFRQKKDRVNSLGAFLLLKKALQDLSFYQVPKMETGAHGKPFFPQYPGLFFNLSHAGKRVMCVISDRPVGCDVEKVRSGYRKVGGRYFTKEEQCFIEAGANTEECDSRFFRLWTMKESAVKATGQGLTQPLNSFTITISDEGPRIEGFSDQTYTAFEIDCGIGYKAAVVIESNSPETPCVVWKHFIEQETER